MSIFYPDFYPAFRCKAAACRHSCCRGWEIDVDEDSAAYYRALPGPLGQALRTALVRDDEGWHFHLDSRERCPFLQPDGLCRLIRELGEEALCDICALHPRFFQELGQDELWGMGLSCEAVTAMLLERQELRFLCEETGESLTLSGLLERLGFSVPPWALCYRPQISPERHQELLHRFAATEPIDEQWPQELAALKKQPPLPEAVDPVLYQRMYQYIFYRQIERLPESGWEAVADYARLAVDLIVSQDGLCPDPAEHLRRFSEQIEYSTENVDRLMHTAPSSPEN